MTVHLRSGWMYLTVELDSTGRPKPVKVTTRQPQALDAGQIVIRMKVAVPAAAFAPLDGGELIVADTDLHATVTTSSVGGL